MKFYTCLFKHNVTKTYRVVGGTHPRIRNLVTRWGDYWSPSRIREEVRSTLYTEGCEVSTAGLDVFGKIKSLASVRNGSYWLHRDTISVHEDSKAPEKGGGSLWKGEVIQEETEYL